FPGPGSATPVPGAGPADFRRTVGSQGLGPPCHSPVGARRLPVDTQPGNHGRQRRAPASLDAFTHTPMERLGWLLLAELRPLGGTALATGTAMANSGRQARAIPVAGPHSLTGPPPGFGFLPQCRGTGRAAYSPGTPGYFLTALPAPVHQRKFRPPTRGHSGDRWLRPDPLYQ